MESKATQAQEHLQEIGGEEMWTKLILKAADVAAETREWCEAAREAFEETTFETKEKADAYYWQMVKPHDYQYAAQIDILTNVFCVSEDLARELVEDAMNRRAAERAAEQA